MTFPASSLTLYGTGSRPTCRHLPQRLAIFITIICKLSPPCASLLSLPHLQGPGIYHCKMTPSIPRPALNYTNLGAPLPLSAYLYSLGSCKLPLSYTHHHPSTYSSRSSNQRSCRKFVYFRTLLQQQQLEGSETWLPNAYSRKKAAYIWLQNR